MIRIYHNHKLQTNPWHREEEPHNNHETQGRQTKQSNQLTLPHQDDWITRMDTNSYTATHRTITESDNGSYNQHRINNNRTTALERTAVKATGGLNALYWYMYQIFALDFNSQLFTSMMTNNGTSQNHLKLNPIELKILLCIFGLIRVQLIERLNEEYRLFPRHYFQCICLETITISLPCL